MGVNSMGALGTVFTGVLISTLHKGNDKGSWKHVWFVLAGLCALPCIVLLSAALAEHRHVILRERDVAGRGGLGTRKRTNDGKLPPQQLGAPIDDAEELPMLEMDVEKTLYTADSNLKRPNETRALQEFGAGDDDIEGEKYSMSEVSCP